MQEKNLGRWACLLVGEARLLMIGFDAGHVLTIDGKNLSDLQAEITECLKQIAWTPTIEGYHRGSVQRVLAITEGDLRKGFKQYLETYVSAVSAN